MGMRTGGRAAAAAAVALALACGGDPGGAGAALPTETSRENARPGDRGWLLRQRAAPGQLEGYAGAASVNHGESIEVHARADAPRRLGWKLYRMGWYGGAEGRLVDSGGPVEVGPQPAPQPSADTGLVECRWPVTFTIETRRSWPSGVYLVAMTREDGPQSYVLFVVRADERRGAAVFQLSVATYQAYNGWGGRSLYPPYRAGSPSGGKGTGDGPVAQEVSFDRPYEEGNGAGQYFKWEHEAVKWAESRGYDLVYVTNVDLDRDPRLLARQRLFLSVGHDEYWSGRARDALEAAVASGTSVAFLSGNAMYWQVRFEPARGSGAPRRTMVCYKTPGRDPLRGTAQETIRFRDPPVNRPENALLGLMYTCWDRADTGWTVAGAHHWIYEGTGVKDGDVIPGIVGYETDRVVDDARWPTPAGTVRLSHSPVADMVTGRLDAQEAAVHEPRPGQFVFAAGTIEFAWGLARDGVADRRVQRMADNVFRRAGLEPASGGTLQRAP